MLKIRIMVAFTCSFLICGGVRAQATLTDIPIEGRWSVLEQNWHYNKFKEYTFGRNGDFHYEEYPGYNPGFSYRYWICEGTYQFDGEKLVTHFSVCNLKFNDKLGAGEETFSGPSGADFKFLGQNGFELEGQTYTRHLDK
jgi:hypothetical protein